MHDPRLGGVVLARDRTAVHPLFHLDPGAPVLVASTDGRVLQAGLEPSPLALAAWLVRAPLEPERTLLEGLFRIPAGHVLTVRERGAALAADWRPPAPGDLPAADAGRFGELLEAELEPLARSGRLAVFLSGGIDSACVAAAAAAVSARAGQPPALALTVEIEGASEAEMQTLVAGQLGLQRLDARAAWQPGALAPALERAAGELWPIAPAWARAFDELGLRAHEAGARLLLDGQGGDDLLDAGLAGGRELLLRPRAFAGWLEAERRYTGGRRQSLRAVAGSFRPRRPPTLPEGLPADPRLRAELVERLASRPRGYAAVREADVTDPALSAQREATFDRGRRLGAEHVHPLWSARLVELLDGLPPAALVAHGDPKSPARAYLAGRLAQPRGAWPRPAVADTLFRAVAAEAHRHLREPGALENLRALGLVDKSVDRPYRDGLIWPMLCVDWWIGSREGT